jgi:uncharacterized lipoprotein YddW (UPF0748 family)
MGLNRSLFAGLMVAGGLIGGGMEPMPAPAQTPEMRGMWISRFEWPSSNEATAKANIDGMMQTLADNNFNTVFFQVRGQADVHYPSPDEPWSNTYGWTNPGWDPLAYAIQSARSRGLEFHAYFNTHTLAAPVPPANTTPQHPFNLHGPNAPGEQSWMIRNSSGVAGLVPVTIGSARPTRRPRAWHQVGRAKLELDWS